MGPGQAQTNVAKAVCDACSVRAQCLDYALAANAQYGVFGGMSEEERREVRRRVGHALRAGGGGPGRVGLNSGPATGPSSRPAPPGPAGRSRPA